MTDRAEVSEADIEEDEGVTFEFADMDPTVAEDILGQVMAQMKTGTVSTGGSGEWR